MLTHREDEILCSTGIEIRPVLGLRTQIQGTHVWVAEVRVWLACMCSEAVDKLHLCVCVCVCVCV